MQNPVSSVSKLTHIKNIPKKNYYTASQLKRFIPIHYPTLKGNISSILHSILPQLQEQYSVGFLPDTRFPQILSSIQIIKKIGYKFNQFAIYWFQDIDDDNQEHLKKSLEIGVIICDYLRTMCQIKKQKQTSVLRSEDKDKSRQSSPAKFKKIHYHKSREKEDSCIAKIERISTIIGNQEETSNQNYVCIPFSQQKQSPQFINAHKSIFSYFIWKQNSQKRYYFAVGHNDCPIESAYATMDTFRQWNTKRLKIPHQLHPYQTLEQIFTISRSFLLNREVEDFNNNRTQLKTLNKIVKESKEMNSIQMYQLLKENGLLTFFSVNNRQKSQGIQQNLLHTYKGKIITKKSLKDPESERQIYEFTSFLWSQILLYTEANSPCSYYFQYYKDDSINQITIIVSVSYSLNIPKFYQNKLNEASRLNLFLSSQNIQKMLGKAINFHSTRFFQQSLTSETITDDIFKKSIQILKRYDRDNLLKIHQQMVSVQNSRMQTSKIIYEKAVSPSPSPIKKYLNPNHSNPSLNQSAISESMIRAQNKSQRDRLNLSSYVNPKNREGQRSRLNKSGVFPNEEDRLNRSSISMGQPSILRIENYYYQLLKKIERQIQVTNQINKIDQKKDSPGKYTNSNDKSRVSEKPRDSGIQPEKLRSALLENISFVQKVYQTTDRLSEEQHLLLKSIGGMCTQLKGQQIACMIYTHCISKQLVKKQDKKKEQNQGNRSSLNHEANFQSFNGKSTYKKAQNLYLQQQRQLKTYHPQNLDPIVQIFLQPQQQELAIQIGKHLAQHNLINLYKSYVSSGSFKNLRFSLIPQYLKNVVDRYSKHYMRGSQNNGFAENAFNKLYVNLNNQKIKIDAGQLIKLFTLEDQINGNVKKLSQSQIRQKNGSLSLYYHQALQKIVPHIFSDEKAQKNLFTVADILTYYYDYLINYIKSRQSNSNPFAQQELASCFLLQLAFECVFFINQKIQFQRLTNDAYLRSSNAPYSQFTNRFQFYENVKKVDLEKQTLKAKKITNLIRQHGFKGLGYQSKHFFIPLTQALSKEQLKRMQNPIYYIISIRRPLLVKKFFDLLDKSHFTPKFVEIIAFYNVKKDLKIILQRETQNKGKSIAHCYFKTDIDQFSFQKVQTKQNEQDFLNQGAKNSESGIFKQLYAYNPMIKIAGLPLSRILQPKSSPQKWNALKRNGGDSNTNTNLDFKSNSNIFDLNTVFKKTLNQKTFETYDLIRTILNLREKYIKYHLLDDDQRTYFRQIVSQIVAKKEAIENYLDVSRKLNLYRHQIRKQQGRREIEYSS